MCVGFVTGRISYTSIALPHHKIDRSDNNNIGLNMITSSSCELCVNPTGYVGLLEIVPKMQNCGIGSIILQTYV